jgi:hypothetical protein
VRIGVNIMSCFELQKEPFDGKGNVIVGDGRGEETMVGALVDRCIHLPHRSLAVLLKTIS